MVSLEWAAGLGRAIPESWFPEVLKMTEEKCINFSKRFPHGAMLPEEPKPAKKAAPKKKAVPKKKAAKKAKK